MSVLPFYEKWLLLLLTFVREKEKDCSSVAFPFEKYSKYHQSISNLILPGASACVHPCPEPVRSPRNLLSNLRGHLANPTKLSASSGYVFSYFSGLFNASHGHFARPPNRSGKDRPGAVLCITVVSGHRTASSVAVVGQQIRRRRRGRAGQPAAECDAYAVMPMCSSLAASCFKTFPIYYVGWVKSSEQKFVDNHPGKKVS